MVKRTASAAEIARARYNLLTPAMVAERLQADGVSGKDRITADTVRSWIEEGDPTLRLRALDLRSPGATRPRYFLEWEWVEDFLERRSTLTEGHVAA